MGAGSNYPELPDKIILRLPAMIRNSIPAPSFEGCQASGAAKNKRAQTQTYALTDDDYLIETG